MNMNGLKFLIMLLLLTAGARASAALRLYTWQPHVQGPLFVLGVRSSETPPMAARRYLHGITTNTALAHELIHSPLPEMPFERFAALSDDDFFSRVLFIANRPEDYAPHDNWRIDSLTTPARQAGLVPYFVPYAADVGLRADESHELIELLNLHFASLMPIGGADLNLIPFGGSNERSINVNPARDAFEIALVARKVRTTETKDLVWVPERFRNLGFLRQDRLAGICRGAQLVALLKRQMFDPDVAGHGRANENPVSEFDRDEDLELQSSPEPTHRLKIFMTSQNLTLNSVRDKWDRIRVNTYHHQRIIYVPGRGMELAAVNPDDNVVEALESTDGSIWILQFHPELMATRSSGELKKMGEAMMRALLMFLTPQSCARALVEKTA